MQFIPGLKKPENSCTIKLKEQNNFLYSLKHDLEIGNTNRSLSLQDLKNKAKIISLKREFAENKKTRIVEVLWEFSKQKHESDNSNNSICSVKNLIVYIGKFIRGFKGKLICRKNDFEREVIFHPKRDEKYMEINEKLLYDAEIHYPDNCIILDAHHLSLNECIAIEFVTADDEMIKKVNNIIDSLRIDKFHYLKDFLGCPPKLNFGRFV